MAYSASGMSKIGGANGFTLWHYKSTTDTLATIMANAYFDTIANMVRVGDKITIQGSDGVWDDFVESVVTTAGSEDVQVGIDPTIVDDSLVGAQYRLGTRRARYDGTEWVYYEGAGALTELDVAIIVTLDSEAVALTDSNAAQSVGYGADLCVLAEGLSQDVADGDFFWGCIKAPASAGQKVNVAASVEMYHRLAATSTPGVLGEADASAIIVDGIVSTEEDDVEPVAVINYPRTTMDLII